MVTPAALKTEAQATRQQLEQTQRALADEKASHAKTCESLRGKTLEGTQLTQQVIDLQERIATEERHRQSLEENINMRGRRWSISDSPPKSSAIRTSASMSSRCSTCRPSCAP